ncbi:hypothetical protein sos41_34040 [Alphaproteobacteria bacterium SO-S41]|nr:hypothetical protein sos41_34040 [Alphaproteobacteria bacterium SO-S41]
MIPPVVLTPEQAKARRSRNIAVALMLVALVALFFVMTIVRMGGAVMDRPM